MLPKIDPVMKLVPTIKLTGKSTVLSINKLTLLVFKLFCIPTIKVINKQELNIIMKDNFLIEINI